jgi:hypothetical protein
MIESRDGFKSYWKVCKVNNTTIVRLWLITLLTLTKISQWHVNLLKCNYNGFFLRSAFVKVCYVIDFTIINILYRWAYFESLSRPQFPRVGISVLKVFKCIRKYDLWVAFSVAFYSHASGYEMNNKSQFLCGSRIQTR